MATANTGETVRVIVRCRPMNQREMDLKCQVKRCFLTHQVLVDLFWFFSRRLYRRIRKSIKLV